MMGASRFSVFLAAAVGTAMIALSVGVIGDVHAAADPDHLKCYKIKDQKTFKSAQVELTALLSEFGMPESCELKGKAKHFCVPVSNAVMSVEDGTLQSVDGDYLNADQLCYKLKKCPKTEIPPREVSDLFGTRNIEKFKASKLCVPAYTEGLPVVPFCGNGVIEPGETCESDNECAGGESCNSCCVCMDSQCPDTLVLTRFDPVGTTTTASDNDAGWTGISHNNDVGDLVEQRLKLCSVSGAGPNSCGVATIGGIDPAGGMCRCENDRRQVCDEPLSNDDDDCGGALCTCYWSAPGPAVSLGFPTCSDTLFAKDVSGTFNVDTGDAEIHASLIQGGNLGEGLLNPCPTCDGDLTLNDGVRDGTCSGGPQDGMSCDAQSLSASFPAPGGGAYGIDCGPNTAVLSGGMHVNKVFTTGVSVLEATVPCGPNGEDLCHCGRCDADTTIPCNSDADCGAGGLCGVESVGNPAQNGCTDQVCTDLGNGQGECSTGGPVSHFCDGIVRASGMGFIACTTNDDCSEMTIGTDAGECSIVENRSCHPSTITVSGTPSVTDPFLVTAVCISPGFAAAANLVGGFPGPQKYNMQTSAELPCAGDPGATYPNCP